MKSTSTLIILFLFAIAANVYAEKKERAATRIKLADGQVTMTSAKTWVSKTPKFKGIVDFEFEVPPSEKDGVPGRVTVGGAGGGVEANFNRWKSQFVGFSSIEKKLDVAGQVVHVLDLKGTYKGSRFRNEPEMTNARMLAAIIVTKKLGSYYVKFNGSRRTVAANEAAFKSVINSLKVAAKK